MGQDDPSARTRIDSLPAEQLTRLLGQLGHEVGTPLGSVLMMAEMLADESVDPGLQRRAEGLKQAATEVRDLVQAFVRLVRLGTGWLSPQPSDVDGEAFGRAVARAAEVAAGTGSGEIRVSISDLPDGHTDLDFVRDAVGCCCLWAPGASLNVNAEAVDGRSRAETAGESRVRCVLRSQGRPVPWNDPGVLDPLVAGDLQVSRRHGGSGLQLALARMLAWRLGGDLAGRFDEAAGENVLNLWFPCRASDPLVEQAATSS